MARRPQAASSHKRRRCGLHPELIKVSRLADHYRWQGPGMSTGMCTTPISGNSAAGGWEGPAPVPGLSEADATAGR